MQTSIPGLTSGFGPRQSQNITDFIIKIETLLHAHPMFLECVSFFLNGKVSQLEERFLSRGRQKCRLPSNSIFYQCCDVSNQQLAQFIITAVYRVPLFANSKTVMLDLFLKANTLLCCKRKQGRGNSQRQHYLHLHWKPVRLAGKLADFFFLIVTFFFSGHTPWLARSQFPHQESNSCPLQWKHGILTTGLPRNSQLIFSFFLVYAFANILAEISPTTYSMQQVTSVF